MFNINSLDVYIIEYKIFTKKNITKEFFDSAEVCSNGRFLCKDRNL